MKNVSKELLVGVSGTAIGALIAVAVITNMSSSPSQEEIDRRIAYCDNNYFLGFGTDGKGNRVDTDEAVNVICISGRENGYREVHINW